MKKVKYFTYSDLYGEETEQLLLELRKLIREKKFDELDTILDTLQYDQITKTVTIDGGEYISEE